MKTQKETVLSLTSDIQALENKLMSLRARRSYINPFHKSILSIADDIGNFFLGNADALVKEIVQRDSPMTAKQILQVFETSGFDFNESHIQACNPDSEESCRSYAIEMEQS